MGRQMRHTDLQASQPCPAEDPPVHEARALTGPAGIAHIRLDGMTYTLRITRAGKLILTK